MPQEYIEIRGARENNLKNVSMYVECKDQVEVNYFWNAFTAEKNPNE